MSASKTRTLRFFKKENGVKVQWEVTLDHTNTAIDGPRPSAPVTVPTAAAWLQIPEHATPSQRVYYATMASRGYRFKIREDMGIDLTYTPPDRILLARFLTPECPCWFPECEALRQELATRIAAAKEAAAKENRTCPECDLLAIKGSFAEEHVLPLLRKQLEQPVDELHPSP